MSTRTRLVSIGLLAVLAGSAHAQPTVPPPGGVPRPVYPSPDLIPSPSVPAVPREKSVDDLLTELESLHAQKAALEKQEQELTAALRKKLDAQAERLKKLGVKPKDAEPDRVGKVILEENDPKDEKMIRDALGLQPSQILKYPALEEARVRLIKAGFHAATVEVIPGESDSALKDIRVRISGPLPGLPLVPNNS